MYRWYKYRSTHGTLVPTSLLPSSPPASSLHSSSLPSALDIQQSQAQNEDSVLEGERRLKYKGTARIGLDVLFFRQDQPRESNKRQADFLVDCFRKEGCHRLPFCNHVPVIIDQESLDAAMQRLGKTADALLTNNKVPDYPLLEFPTSFHLKCLHGRHRIEAGREFLDPGDDWWTVDLYLSGEVEAF
ncbi:hypothetical protein BJ875DRAFT_229273 [Amylocarpus encephaloides]|uniref:Uncharacterized protein n=1 Tax=Amylocarpus encephaloides TaxID=45428 RepID=A0A9P7Y7W4_9HELO|nr:hypothetical protein BJ875DRAFT_229273 [Amylocarpus encephaloides]